MRRRRGARHEGGVGLAVQLLDRVWRDSKKTRACVLVALIPFCSFADEIPSASVILDSWQRSVDDLASIPSYQIKGSYQGASVFIPRGKTEIGSWEADKEGIKYRWDFQVPAEERRVLTYDGHRWSNMTDLRRSHGGDVRGGIFSDPERVMGGEPHKIYEDLATVYPFALEQILASPLRLPTQRSMPSEYRSRLNRVRVGKDDGGRGYRLSLADSNKVGDDFMPQEVHVESFMGRFVPTAITRVSPPRGGRRNVQTTTLKAYRDFNGTPVPAEIDVEMYSIPAKGTWAKTWIASLSKKYDLVRVRDGVDPKVFAIDFPAGALVYDQALGRAVSMGRETSLVAARVKARKLWIVPSLISVAVATLMGIGYAIYRRRAHESR